MAFRFSATFFAFLRFAALTGVLATTARLISRFPSGGRLGTDSERLGIEYAYLPAGAAAMREDEEEREWGTVTKRERRSRALGGL